MPSASLVVSEAQWQELVVDFARLHGWATYHQFDSRRSDEGWPDLVLVRPPELVIAELKSEAGRLSVSQDVTLNALRACGVEACLWRPSDEELVFARLGRPRAASRRQRAGEQRGMS